MILKILHIKDYDDALQSICNVMTHKKGKGIVVSIEDHDINDDCETLPGFLIFFDFESFTCSLSCDAEKIDIGSNGRFAFSVTDWEDMDCDERSVKNKALNELVLDIHMHHGFTIDTDAKTIRAFDMNEGRYWKLRS